MFRVHHGYAGITYDAHDVPAVQKMIGDMLTMGLTNILIMYEGVDVTGVSDYTGKHEGGRLGTLTLEIPI